MTPQSVILLAEPDPIIAVDLKDALEKAGYHVLGPVGTAAGALLLLEQEKPTLAIIDVVLKDGPCTTLVQALRQRRVPFLVHSAARRDQQLTGDVQDAPWLDKRAASQDVVACMSELSTAAVKPTASIHPLHPSTASRNPLIRKLEGFTTLSEADRSRLASISAETRRVMPGTDLVREGDGPVGVFLVMDGIVCRHKLRANGARQIMAYLVPGDLCDLDVALLGEMDHTLTTLSACEVVRLSPETAADLLAHYPQIARGLRKSQLVDEATLREWLVNVGRRAAPERIAHLLCELLARLRVVDRATGDGYALPITQVDLADTTGLTPVHVNRTLRELRKKGLSEFKKGQVKILDLPRLKALAEFRPNYLHLGEQATA